MKRIAAFLFAALAAVSSFAAGNDMVDMQRNAADTATQPRIIPHPTSTAFRTYNAVTFLPDYLVIGSGFTITSGVIDVAAGSPQIQSDWGQTNNTALDYVKNKPAFATVAISGLFADLLSKPTTVAGYGITDAVTPTSLASSLTGYVTSTSLTTTLGSYATNATLAGYVTSSALTTALAGKFNQPTGTNVQCVRGDGSVGACPLPNVGTAGTYSGVTTDAQGRVTSGTTWVFNTGVSRPLNSSYTISSTRNASVSYSINAAWTVQALLSGSGTVFLEYSTNGGSSWVTVNQVGKTLNLLTFQGSDDMNVAGDVPANALVRLRMTNSNMTVTYVTGQEVLK